MLVKPVWGPSPETVSNDKLNSMVDYAEQEAHKCFEDADDYSNVVTYRKSAVAKSGGIRYVSLVDNNLNHTPASSPTYWEIFGGGSSGSGHIILDPSDSEMTQRSKLKFLGSGVTVADNATDGQTEVTIITSATRIRRGSGAPSSTLGVDGDMYINTTTGTGAGDLYEKISGSYTVVGNVRGPQGTTGTAGTAGTNGATWRDGAGVPDNSVGVNGDYYLDTLTGDVYKRASGAYGVIANIMGADGTTDATKLQGVDVSTTAPTNGQVLKYNSSTSKWEPGASSGAGDYVMLQHQVSSGTSGGTFSSGAWRTRTLNVEVADTGSNAALSSNQVTLQPGTYRFNARGIAYSVDSHQMRLQNITAGTTVALGESNYSTPTGNTIFPAGVSGRFTIASATVFELQHRCFTSRSTDGFGYPCSFGSTEVYATLEFFKE